MTDILIRNSIEHSIEDVISMLDSSPVQWDMISSQNAIQIAKRAQNAHLVLERGLKTLIRFGGGAIKRAHSLNKLFIQLEQVDSDTSDFLATAFEDAVGFYGYDVCAVGFRHFKNIRSYFNRTGSHSAYETYRYWVTDFIDDQAAEMPPISLEVHRELLCAIARFIGLNDKQTVSERIHWAVFNALSPTSRHLGYSDGDSGEEAQRRKNAERYVDWFNSTLRDQRRRPLREVLRDAAKHHFNVEDSGFVGEVLKAGYEELKNSTDPAVRYYLMKFDYLPRGSQLRIPGFTPTVEWFAIDRHGAVNTSGGDTLGYIQRYADGAWRIDPWGGRGKGEIAETQADAKWYLVNRLSHEVEVSVGGRSRLLRLVQDDDWFVQTPISSGDIEDAFQPMPFKLRFWDACHGLTVGETIKATLARRSGQHWMSLLEGEITAVDGHGVTVTGHNRFDVADHT